MNFLLILTIVALIATIVGLIVTSRTLKSARSSNKQAQLTLTNKNAIIASRDSELKGLNRKVSVLSKEADNAKSASNALKLINNTIGDKHKRTRYEVAGLKRAAVLIGNFIKE